MIKDTLKELGLSQKEIDVYLVTLEYGKLSPAKISKLTSINRTTVYPVAKDLVKRGFLSEDTTQKTTYYYPASERELLKITKRERQLLIQKELILEELTKDIKNLPQAKTYVVPKIKFIEYEEEIESFLYSESLKWVESMTTSSSTMLGFQDHTFVEHEPYVKWIDWNWKSIPDTVDLKFLSNDKGAEKERDVKTYPRRNIKFWNGSLNFTTSQWIMGEYSIVIQTREKPYYLIEMHDAVYAQNMRELFKNLWEEI